RRRARCWRARASAAIACTSSRQAPCWRDRALIELNLAVLHSYERAGGVPAISGCEVLPAYRAQPRLEDRRHRLIPFKHILPPGSEPSRAQLARRIRKTLSGI